MSFDNPPAVLDTNVLISAAILPGSSSARALVQAFRHFHLVLSEATWDELRDVIARKKFKRYLSDQARNEFLGLVIRSSRFIESRSLITDCADPMDNKFLALAVDSGASLIVSSDAHLLVMHPYRGIPIRTPSEFLEGLTRQTENLAR